MARASTRTYAVVPLQTLDQRNGAHWIVGGKPERSCVEPLRLLKFGVHAAQLVLVVPSNLGQAPHNDQNLPTTCRQPKPGWQAIRTEFHEASYGRDTFASRLAPPPQCPGRYNRDSQQGQPSRVTQRQFGMQLGANTGPNGSHKCRACGLCLGVALNLGPCT